MAESGGVLRQLVAVFGIGVDTSDLKKGENELESFVGSLKKIGAGIAGIFAIKEIHDFVDNSVKAMTAIERSASQLGISAEKVQEFQYASKSLGMDSDALVGLMGRLQVSQQAAGTGAGAAGKAFSSMGVHVKDANGHFKSADELFLDVADGISKTSDASKQAAIATAVFGRSGRQLLPFLKQGRKGAEELAAEFKQLGGGYSEKAIEQSKKYEHESAKLDLVLTGLKNTIMTAVLPAFTKIVGWITQIVRWFRELADHSSILQATLVVLGAAATYFAVQMAIAAAPVLLIAAAVAALILVVDDIITMFRGGDSVIGDAIDKLFGKDAHIEVVKELQQAWETVKADIQGAWEYLKGFTDTLQKIGSWTKDKASKVGNVLGKVGGFIGEAVGSARVADLEEQNYVKGGSGSYNSEGSYVPRLSPPSAQMSMAGNQSMSSDTNISMTVNASPGMDVKALAEHTAHEVDKRLAQRNRETAATFQRGTAQ